MVMVPRGHYCVVRNPVVRDADGSPVAVADGHGELRTRDGEREIRECQDPFPLYPGAAGRRERNVVLAPPMPKAAEPWLSPCVLPVLAPRAHSRVAILLS